MEVVGASKANEFHLMENFLVQYLGIVVVLSSMTNRIRRKPHENTQKEI